MYFQKNAEDAEEESLKLLEISFVKVELREGVGTAPKPVYQLFEDDYYKGRESILFLIEGRKTGQKTGYCFPFYMGAGDGLMMNILFVIRQIGHLG